MSLFIIIATQMLLQTMDQQLGKHAHYKSRLVSFN